MISASILLGAKLVCLLVVFAMLGFASISDFKTRSVPNFAPIVVAISLIAKLTLSGDFAALIFATIRSVCTFAALFLITLILNKKFSKDTFGGADIKLTSAASVFATADEFVVYMLATFLFASIFGIVFKLVTKKDGFPFAPACLVGFACATFLPV